MILCSMVIKSCRNFGNVVAISDKLSQFGKSSCHFGLTSQFRKRVVISENAFSRVIIKWPTKLCTCALDHEWPNANLIDGSSWKYDCKSLISLLKNIYTLVLSSALSMSTARQNIENWTFPGRGAPRGDQHTRDGAAGVIPFDRKRNV